MAAIQMMQVQQGQSTGMFGMDGTSALGQSNGFGGFGMILDQLLAMTKANQQMFSEDLMGMAGSSQADDLDNQLLNGQMMAEMMMMFGFPSMMQQLVMQGANPEQVAAVTETMVNPEQMQNFLQALYGQENGDNNVQKSGSEFDTLVNGQQQTYTEAEILNVGQNRNAEGQSFSDGSELLGGEGKFQNAVAEAQKLLQDQKPGKTEDKTADLEKLQGEVDSGKFIPASSTETVRESESTAASKSVYEQVKTGIMENLGKGKDEFVVKLKPEGLGAVTVKMVEQSGRMAVSIMTESAQTAKLLAGEIAGLRDVLRPFNADVREVVVQTQTSGEAAMSQYDMGQQFGQHQQQFQNGSNEVYYYSSEFGLLDEQEEETDILMDSGLDTYI